MAQRKFYRRVFEKGQKTIKTRKSIFWKIFISCGFLFLFFLLFLVFLFVWYAKDLPRPEKFTERQFIESTKIYDRTGKVLLYEIYGEEKRRIISLNQVPEQSKQAIIATEDSNFYRHFGLDFRGIFRAIINNIKRGEAFEGGSTISQQLIRSSFLTREKTLKRKVREIILTLELERRYSKDEILEFYLNQVPFGQNSYGVEAASLTYFGKSVSEISLPESAILAALIKAPSYLSPYGSNLPELLSRKNYVLEQMEKLGYINQEGKEKARAEEIKFSQIKQAIKAPHFVMHIKDELLKKYSEDFLKEKGLRVYTTLDWELQETAEKAVKEGSGRNRAYKAYNASLVALDPKTGEILAMVGSKDFFAEPEPKNCQSGKSCLFEPQFNVAMSLPGRQPGSAFKPFVYATAFKKGYDDKTIVVDEETNFGIWGGKSYIPQNYDGKFRGPVTLREALGQSLNVPSVKVLNSLAGLEDSIKTAKEMGITTLTQDPYFYGLSLVLGGGEAKLLDMVSSYGVFAAKGYKAQPTAILKIEDKDGNLIEKNQKSQKLILSSQVAILINDILSDNSARTPIFGANSVMYFKDHEVAAKTGTTQDYKDGWIIGYTPSLAVGVWAGNNDNTPMLKEPGVVVAGPIWRDFMNKALAKFPKESLTQ